MNKGFTIIELIMTIIVIGILAWVGVAAMLSGVDAWSFFTQRKDILADGTMAVDRACREMRMVRNTTSVTTANATTFRFTDTSNNDITYTLSSGTINRTQNGTVNGLLSSVSSLAFTYYDSAGAAIATPTVAPSATNIRRIRVEIGLLKGESQTVNLRQDVWPRNLR